MFSKRLEQLRLEKELTHQQMAEMLGITRQAYGNYENGKREPDFATAKKFADFFNVSIDYLLGRTDIRNSFNNRVDILSALEENSFQLTAGDSPLTHDQRLGILRALDNPSAFKKKTVPILGKVPAGIPVLAAGCWDGELEIPSDIEADFALEVKGDSMIGAGIHEGDYAICRDAQGANSGDIVVALEDIGPEYSVGTLKYYFKENDLGVLRAANPDYEDIHLGETYRITGNMIGLIRKGHTPFGYYKDYIYLRDYHLQEWNDVIEEVAKYGMKPTEVRQILVPQLEYLKRMVREK